MSVIINKNDADKETKLQQVFRRYYREFSTDATLYCNRAVEKNDCFTLLQASQIFLIFDNVQETSPVRSSHARITYASFLDR